MPNYYISGEYKQFIYTASADTYILFWKFRYLPADILVSDVLGGM